MHAHEEACRNLLRFRSTNADRYGDTGLLEPLDTLTGDTAVGIAGSNNHPLDASSNQRVGTRRRAMVSNCRAA